MVSARLLHCKVTLFSFVINCFIRQNFETMYISHQNFNLLIYFLHQHRFMNSYFIQWVIICYCHCLFECSPYPALASGSPFNLDYFFLACPCHFLSTSLISIRRSVFSHLYPEVSPSPGSSGSFSWKTIFGY